MNVPVSKTFTRLFHTYSLGIATVKQKQSVLLFFLSSVGSTIFIIDSVGSTTLPWFGSICSTKFLNTIISGHLPNSCSAVSCPTTHLGVTSRRFLDNHCWGSKAFCIHNQAKMTGGYPDTFSRRSSGTSQMIFPKQNVIARLSSYFASTNSLEKVEIAFLWISD